MTIISRSLIVKPFDHYAQDVNLKLVIIMQIISLRNKCGIYCFFLFVTGFTTQFLVYHDKIYPLVHYHQR